MKPEKKPQGPKEGEYGVLRGGSWHSASQFCRAASRGRGTPGGRNVNLGFRIVLIPKREKP